MFVTKVPTQQLRIDLQKTGLSEVYCVRHVDRASRHSEKACFRGPKPLTTDHTCLGLEKVTWGMGMDMGEGHGPG